jgi:predicted nucleic acid-binding protein
MLVVSDTSPITNLIQIDLLHLLQEVYGEIIIPQTVYDELCEIDFQKQLLAQQTWIRVMTAQDRELVSLLESDLDKGESESIALAVELNAQFLIIDESKGRQKAESLGIKIIGLLGTLLKAKHLGLLTTVKPIIEKLNDEVGFHINPKLKAYILDLAQE